MSTQSEAAEIMLSEDDATALKLLLLVVHHQNKRIPKRLAARTVLTVAIAADKYDCSSALHFASESWLRPDQSSMEDLVFPAAAAFRLGNATAFRGITKRMILGHSDPFTIILGADVLNETDWRILGECQYSQFVERCSTYH